MITGARIIIEIGGHGLGNSIVNAIIEKGGYKNPVQITTREQRNKDDNFYEFATQQAFIELIENKKMFEFIKTYNGTFYGTTISAIDDLLRKNEDVFIRLGEYSEVLTLKQKYADALFLLMVDVQDSCDDWGKDNNYESVKKCADFVITKEYLDQDGRITEESLDMILKEVETKAKRVISLSDEEARIYNEFISENNISENEIIGQLQGNETDIDLVIGGDGMARFVIVKLNDGFPDRLLEIGNIHLQDVDIVEKQLFPEALRASCVASVLYNKALGDASKNICRDQNLAYLLSDKLKKAAEVYHECLDAKNNA